MNFAIAQNVDAVLYGYADKVSGKKENEHVFELHGNFRGDQIAKDVIPSFLGHSYEDVNEWLKGKRGCVLEKNIRRFGGSCWMLKR